jgi:cell division protein FtsI/penicillin-binding protein 2
MGHTRFVQSISRLAASAAAIAVSWALCPAAGAQGWQSAVDHAARESPDARIVLVDVATGRLLAAYRLAEAARTLAAPGSTLKPLILYGLLAAGRWSPDRRVACDRRLAVAGHRLACSHPQAPPFDAREALTWSCNSYFAELARTLRPDQLALLLRPSGLLGETGLAPREAAAECREPRTAEATQLAVLGVDGVRVTPLELAAAYRWLAREMAAHPASSASATVQAGLEDSASFGMAGLASLGGVPVAGKTGTAENTQSSDTHGWFAGLAPAQNPHVVVVVYLPSGRGADAARVAGELLANSPLRKP